MIFILLLLVSNVFSLDLYIDGQNGDDHNNGLNLTTAWQTFEAFQNFTMNQLIPSTVFLLIIIDYLNEYNLFFLLF